MASGKMAVGIGWRFPSPKNLMIVFDYDFGIVYDYIYNIYIYIYMHIYLMFMIVCLRLTPRNLPCNFSFEGCLQGRLCFHDGLL